jgi:hypothetical protein
MSEQEKDDLVAKVELLIQMAQANWEMDHGLVSKAAPFFAELLGK